MYAVAVDLGGVLFSTFHRRFLWFKRAELGTTEDPLGLSAALRDMGDGRARLLLATSEGDEDIMCRGAEMYGDVISTVTGYDLREQGHGEGCTEAGR